MTIEIETISSVITVCIIGLLLFMLLYYNGRPLFSMKCAKCGARDKQWSVVPARYDNFVWVHECETDTNKI